MADVLSGRIAELRKERGLTQEQLGQLVGVSAQAVSKWEKGGAPDVELLPALADRLGVTIDGLFGREEDKYIPWDAVSRYIYTALQGGGVMRGWMNDERVMIACCSDGTRPVIFKIERLDYKALYIDGIGCEECRKRIAAALEALPGVMGTAFRETFVEVYLDRDVPDKTLRQAVETRGACTVTKID